MARGCCAFGESKYGKSIVGTSLDDYTDPMPKTTAPERRLHAIGTVVKTLLNEARTETRPGLTRHEAAETIRPLQSLGRTDRWQTAIVNWQNMVNDTSWDLYGAIIQGGIYAGYEAL